MAGLSLISRQCVACVLRVNAQSHSECFFKNPFHGINLLHVTLLDWDEMGRVVPLLKTMCCVQEYNRRKHSFECRPGAYMLYKHSFSPK